MRASRQSTSGRNQKLLESGFHCNNAHLSGKGGTGDPTELALRISGAKAKLVVDGVHRLVEIPFDSSAKYMAVLVDMAGGRHVLVKGAPEQVIAMCDHTWTRPAVNPAFDPHRGTGDRQDFAMDALRTLAFAMKPVGPDADGLTHDDLSTSLCLACKA